VSLRRRTRVLLPVIIALAAVACGKDDKRSSAATKVAAAPDPWFMSPDNHCAFDSTANHSDAAGLVREYVQRDVQGAFLRSDAWFNSAVECPGHERSASDYIVVASSDVVPITESGDSARVGVRYRLLGAASPDGYRPDLKTVTDTVKLARTRFGWRIVHAPTPHVTVDVAKKHQTFTRADLWAIDASVTQAARLAPR
jgi:hypothetical protein